MSGDYPNTVMNDIVIEEFLFEDEIGKDDDSEWSDSDQEFDSTFNEQNSNLKLHDLPSPPARPDHWKCDPCWHWNTAPSPPADTDFPPAYDSEEGSIAPLSKSQRRRRNRPKNNTEKMEKVKRIHSEMNETESHYRVNIHSLYKRTRTEQPSSIYQLTPAQLNNASGIRKYTIAEVAKGLRIKDVRGNMLVHLYPIKTVSPEILELLVSSWQKYDSNSSLNFPADNYTNKRGNYEVRVLGCWFKSGRFLEPYMTRHYRGPDTGIHYKRKDNPYYIAAKEFQSANKRLWGLVEDLIKTDYPVLYDIYKQISVPEGCHKFAGLFAAVVVNKLVETKAHKDLGDIKGGICVIICWGNFSGGELAFSELCCVVPFPSGSIIVFRSAIITHYNLPVFGERYSMVLMTDKRLHQWSKAKESCK